MLLVFVADDQNLCSTLNAKLDRVPPLIRSNRMRMSAELSPSSEVLLNPSSPPVPQSDVLVVLLICSQIRRGAKENCVLVPATKSAPIGMITSGRSVRLAMETSPASRLRCVIREAVGDTSEADIPNRSSAVGDAQFRQNVIAGLFNDTRDCCAKCHCLSCVVHSLEQACRLPSPSRYDQHPVTRSHPRIGSPARHARSSPRH